MRIDVRTMLKGDCDFTIIVIAVLVGINRFQVRLLDEEFMLIVSHMSFPSSVFKSMELSPTVRESLHVDISATRFVFGYPGINLTDFVPIQDLISEEDDVSSKVQMNICPNAS
jgi:hypothetical protein